MFFFLFKPSILKPRAITLLALFCLFQTPSLANQAFVDSVNGLGHDFLFSNISSSLDLYSDLVDQAHALGYESGEARALRNLATAYALNGLFDDSVEAHLQAIRLLEQNNMLEDLAQAYGDLGYQMKRRDLSSGKRYMRMGINIAEQHDFKVRLCALYDNFGVLHEMGTQLDSAAYYFRRALAFKTSLNDSIGIPFSLNNLASVHAALAEFDVADSLLTLSDAYHQRPEDTYGRLANSVHWGDLRFSQGDLVSAETHYRKSLDMPGATDQNFLMIHCYQQLAQIYEEQQDFRRAYRSQQRFTAYRDSLVTADTNARIAGLEIEFETEKKDRLLAENKLAIESRTRQLIMLGALAVFLAAAGVGFARYQHLKRRQMKRELELLGQLRRAEYEQQLADQKLGVSRELHDNIGAQLTFLISSVDNLTIQSKEEGIQNKLTTIGEFGRTTLSELRQTVWAMKNEKNGLEALGLKLLELKRQCASTGRSLDLQINHTAESTPQMSSSRMLNLYRIAQEAVQNAIKHTDTGSIEVRLESSSEELILGVTDQGKGFDETQAEHLGGLTNMRQRCGESGGQFRVHSDEEGTQILCTFPPE